MMEMRRAQIKIVFEAQADEEMQKRQTVRPTRYADGKRLAGREQAVFLDEGADAGEEHAKNYSV